MTKLYLFSWGTGLRYPIASAFFVVLFICSGFGLSAQTFTNSDGILINDGGPATPYPQTLDVSGIGTVVDISVTISGFSHDWANDVEVLLVGPTGAKSVLFGGIDAIFIGGVDYTFVTSGGASMGVSPPSGTYQPFGVFSGPAPAPSGPHTANLNNFVGTDADGTWSLYVFDSFMDDGGSINEWSITFLFPSCAAPINLTATSVSSSDASFSWLDGVGGTGNNWEVGLSGFTPGNGEELFSGFVAGNSVSNVAGGGLSPGTSYVFAVQNDCESSWVEFSFFTPCVAVSSFPWLETVESNSPTIDCWQTISLQGTPNWYLDNGGPFGSPSSAYSGVQNFAFPNNFPDILDAALLVSPPLDISGFTGTAELEFYYYLAPWLSFVDGLFVYYSTDGGLNFEYLGDYSSATNQWTQALLTLPGPYTSEYVLGFQGLYVFGDGISLDNITVREVFCLQPSAGLASSVTSTSAELSWTENGTATAWDIEIGVSGFTPTGSPSPGLDDVTSNSNIPVGGLSPGTVYQWYVRADCGEDNSDVSNWAGPFAFFAPCNAVASFPWTETVEDDSPTLDCWASYPIVGSDNWGIDEGSIFGEPSSAYQGSNNFTFPNIDAVGPAPMAALLVSPPLDLSGFSGSAELTFHYYCAEWLGNLDELEVYTSPDGENFTFLAAFDQQTTQWTQAILALPQPYSSTYYLGFLGIFLDGDGVSLDEITVAEVSCAIPSALTVNSVTTNSATLSWTENGSATEWSIEYGPSGFAQGSGTVISGITSNPYTTGNILASASSYDFYVQANCGEDSDSQWFGVASAQTVPACGDQFTDTGGVLGEYSNNQSYSFTICPSSPGTVVQLVFSSFNLEEDWDYIRIFNGPLLTSPEITSSYVNPGFGNAPNGSWTGTNSPGGVTSTHPSGCLTVQFISDESLTEEGWVANVLCLGVCSGIPSPGNTQSTFSSVCPNVPFTLSATATGLNTNYIWQRRATPTATWVNIGTTQVPSFTTSQTSAQYYRCRAHCVSSGFTGVSTPVQVTMQNICFPQPPGPLFNSDTYIVSTTINGNTQNTPCGQAAPGSGSIANIYGSYLNQPSIANLVRGFNSTVQVSVGQCPLFFNYSSRVAVYVDFNQDGDFDDFGEEVYESGPGGNLSPYDENIVFAVPVGAQLGQTAMRVIAAETSQNITPQLEFGWGEVEDHVVTIVNPAVVNDLKALATAITTAPYPNCSTNFTANLASATDSPETAGGGNDVWYRFNAVTNAVRIQLTGTNNMSLELHDADGLVIAENDVIANGNETLIFDGLSPSQTYWVAVIAEGSPSSGVICISHLRRSGCDAPVSFSSPCQIFKCTHTAATTYTAYFDDDGEAPFIASSISTPGTTYHPISGFVGLPPMTTTTDYLARVDATYILPDAAGNLVTAFVPSTFVCSRTLNPHPAVFLRDLDAAPNVRPANAIIEANTWLCGALNYQWTLQQYDAVGGSPIAPIPSIINGPSNERRLQLWPLSLIPNGIYKVNTTPIFSTGPGITGPDRWLIIAGPAPMVLLDSDETSDTFSKYGMDVTIYPNPSNGTFVNLSISGVEDNVMVRVLDGTGRIVWKNNLVVEGSLTTLISFDRPLPGGLYAVEMLIGDELITRRLIIQK